MEGKIVLGKDALLKVTNTLMAGHSDGKATLRLQAWLTA